MRPLFRANLAWVEKWSWKHSTPCCSSFLSFISNREETWKLNWLAIIPVCLALIINFSCWCMKLIKSIHFFALHQLLNNNMNFPENQINPYTEHFCLARFITLRIKYHFIKDVHLHFSSFFLRITSQTFTVNAITCPSGVLFCPILLCWMACVIFISDFKRTIISILCIRDIFHNHPQLFISFSV